MSSPDRKTGNAAPLPRATFDEFLADDLKENDVVFIDGVGHKFLMKIPHGPHVFWNGDESKEVRLGTAELLNMMDKKRYYRPGTSSPKFERTEHQVDHDQRIKVAFHAFPDAPRTKAQVKWLYVAKYQQLLTENGTYARNEDNAKQIIEAVANDNETAAPGDKVTLPRKVSPRSVLRWIAKEKNLNLQEAGLVHGNSVTPRSRVIPQKVYEIIGLKIRQMVNASHKFGPTKISIRVNAAIDAHNAAHGTAYQHPSLSTVDNEYRRFDAWIRLAKEKGPDAADLEYGAVGKLVRPERILDLVELDQHKFDLHPTTGELGKTSLGIELAKGGLDRFWICLALDVHSGYPLGFAITFEPGGLVPAVMCIDHAIRAKTYVGERWPNIQGDLLGFGKPVKIRYDNAKEFVSLQLQRNLARIGVGFELAIPGIPNSKPYVERHFGTIERDFVHWLQGSMGANIGEKGDRRPQQEAKVDLDAFMELFHQYLIEVYARRKQEGLDWETPQERWVRGASSPSHRPRPLTPYENARWDVATTLELKLNATRDGIRWKHLFFQSKDLQKLRRMSGTHGPRGLKATPVTVRIPLRDVGKAYVALPPNTPGFPADQVEILAVATNQNAHGRTIWQHDAVCGWLARQKIKMDPTNHADYRIGFLNLFRNAMEYMGLDVDGDGGKVTLSGGQAPRFVGAYMDGPEKPALSHAKGIIDRYDLLKEFAAGNAQEDSDEDQAMAKAAVVIASSTPVPSDDEEDWGAADFDEDDDQ